MNFYKLIVWDSGDASAECWHLRIRTYSAADAETQFNVWKRGGYGWERLRLIKVVAIDAVEYAKTGLPAFVDLDR